MEPIIALGAKHMVDHGEWFVPRLYGEVYAFKPALTYWMAAAAGTTIGWSEWSLRLPTAMCGVLLGLSICLVMGHLVSPRCGLVSGLAAVTACLSVEQARMVGFDMPVALGVGVATLAAMRNLAKGEANLAWWMFGYAGLLFGFLAKGLPAVVTYGAGLFVVAVVLRQTRLLLRWQHLVAAVLFVLGVAAYLVLAVGEGGSLVFTQHLIEIFFRGTRWRLGSILMGLAKPAIILTVFLPCSALLLLIFVRRATEGAEPLSVKLRRAAWAFLLTGTALLVISPVNNTRYYLPLITSLAVLAGLYAESFRFRIPATATPARARRLRVMADPTVWMVLAGAIYWLVYVSVVEPRRAWGDSQRELAARFAVQVPAGQTVYVDTEDSHSSLLWYMGRPVRTWQIGGPLPAGPAWVVLATKQVKLAPRLAEKGLMLVDGAQDHDEQDFALCRVAVRPSTAESSQPSGQ
jgi:4-amino-4-deoxy-L-arabinose transferase-like glycosyltransferase